MQRGKSRVRMALVLSSLAIVAVVIVWYGLYWKRRWDGFFDAADYAWLLTQHDPRMIAHMPGSVPAAATDVRLYSPVYTVLPAPDHMMEARWVLPAAQAAVLLQQTAAMAAPVEQKANFGWGHITDGLLTADDQNAQTPLPQGFKSFLLANPSGYNIAGVSINSQTGEVIYWFFES